MRVRRDEGEGNILLIMGLNEGVDPAHKPLSHILLRRRAPFKQPAEHCARPLAQLTA